MREMLLDTNRAAVGIHSNFSANSSVITNRFFFKLFSGGHISDSDIDKMTNRGNIINNLGFEFNTSIHAAFDINHLLGKPTDSLQLFFRLSDRQLANARLSDDMVQFVLNGNKQYAGEEANFDHFNLQFVRFQQLQLGLIHQLKSGHQYGFAVSAINGEQNLIMQTDRFRVFTEIDGNSISASTNDLEIYQTDTNNTGFGKTNGLGATIDLFYRHQLKSKKEGRKAYLEFEVQDLGFVQWNNQSIHYDIDTTYVFEGIYIEDLFDLNDSILSASNPDTIIDDFKGDAKRESYTYWFPVKLMAQFHLEKDNGWFYTIGGMYRLRANMLPYIYGQYGKQINEHIRLAGTLGAGGYGTFNIGAEAQFNWPWLEIALASNNLEGLALPMYFGGTNLYLSLRKRF